VLATRQHLEDELRQLRADVEILRAALARRETPGAKNLD
jgi:hypothetical protein